VRFRLATTDRSRCHTGRWVGGASEVLPVCIAPLCAPVLPRRVFREESWCLQVSFFAHTVSKPVVGTALQLRSGGFPSEALKPRESLLDQFLLGRSSEKVEMETQNKDIRDEDAEATAIPAGYGHRAVRLVQARARCVGKVVLQGDAEVPGGLDALMPSTFSGAWMEMPAMPIEQCKVSKAPAGLDGPTACKIGDLHTLQISSSSYLQEGGCYEIQLRLGDSQRWSAWSDSSERFPFSVPQPEPAEEGMEVRTLSATVCHFSWPAFVVPAGLQHVTYRLLAEPKDLGSSAQGAFVSQDIHVLPASKPGTTHEATLTNLRPSTEYVYSVSARYQNIGWKIWGQRLSLQQKDVLVVEEVTEWLAPPMPAVFPCNGPRPFAVAEEGLPFFHPSEQAFLLAFADTSDAADGLTYRLQYRRAGLSVDSKSGTWRTPLEVVSVDVEDEKKVELLEAAVAPWKMLPRLWRVRLPPMQEDLDEVAAIHAQKVQFRLAVEVQSECPVTRWYSSLTPPLTSAMAPPLMTKAQFEVTDTRLTIFVQFSLHRQITEEVSLEDVLEADSQFNIEAQDLSPATRTVLPEGFGHMFANRFQVRSRHSPRPQGMPPPDSSRRPPGVPWSPWCEGPDAGWQATEIVNHSGDRAMGGALSLNAFRTTLQMPDGAQLAYGSYYQVSVRISDGTCWSDWSEPSNPIKVYVAPPKPDKPDTEVLSVVQEHGGTNVKLRWSPLRAHSGLKLIEYVLHVHEVLNDDTELCPKRVAALWIGQSAGSEESPDGPETTSYELRNLRLDVNYVFTLAARYPEIGPREFSDALCSFKTNLRPAPAPLAVPTQLSLPLERLRRLQISHFVLLRWTLGGVQVLENAAATSLDIEVDGTAPRYDLQALPDGAGDRGWLRCRNISRLKVEGHLAWLVKDIPGRSLRTRFRLWDRETGRFGRASPPMMTFVDPVKKLGASAMFTESSSQIVLRAPLDSPSGSGEYVCRYQVRYRPERLDAPWVELQPKMLWHRQNDHLGENDEPTDAKGAVNSGLIPEGRDENDFQKRKSHKDGERIKFVDVQGGDEDADRGDPEEPSIEARNFAPGQRQVQIPTIPMATVGQSGEVLRQRVIVASVLEEDGIQPDMGYMFSIRVGDLYRLSEWSLPSQVVKLAAPAPHPSVGLTAAEAQISVSEVTDTGLYATWPQFVPATIAGVPVEAEVEYLLVVLPQKANRRLAGRGKVKEEPSAAHAQWLLSSKLPEGSDVEQVGATSDQRLGMAISGLAPHCSYELKLSVRYARLGPRKWTEALSYVVVTKKSEGISGRSSPPTLPGGPASDSGAVDTKQFLKVKEGPQPRGTSQERSGSLGRVPDSPRRLPPLDATTAALYEEIGAQNAEEWTAAAQADMARLLGGTAPRGEGATQAEENGDRRAPGYPLVKPADFISFWRRDPMDSRPAMPSMPAAHHPASQLGLMGRTSEEVDHPAVTAAPAALAPRPPTHDRPAAGTGRRPLDVERQVYPRRFDKLT